MPRELLTTRPPTVAATFLLSLMTWVVTPACQVLGGYEKFEPAEPPTPHACDALPASKLDAKGLATLVLAKQTDDTCYWIDKTEVTVEQYKAFLQDHSEIWDSQRCGWKSTPSDPANETSHPCSVTALLESEPFWGTKPIRCVDWCDAKAFCNWAGMELCGGWPNTLLESSDVPDQWGNACSPGGEGYPYPTKDSMPIPGVCNVGLTPADCFRKAGQQFKCAPTDVESPDFADCKAESGALDMIGNVAEWVLPCGRTDGPDALCQYRGGSFDSALEDSQCYTTAPFPRRDTRDPKIGLRCCARLTPHEESLREKSQRK